MKSTRTDNHKSPTTASVPRRIAAAAAVVAAAAALGAGATSVAKPAAEGATLSAASCPDWICGGGGNHNEILATTIGAA